MRGPALTTTVSFPNTQEYIDAHGISKTVEEVINATVKAKAPEPCSFMVRALASRGRTSSLRVDDRRSLFGCRDAARGLLPPPHCH